jgi:hypothetical protein
MRPGGDHELCLVRLLKGGTLTSSDGPRRHRQYSDL